MLPKRCKFFIFSQSFNQKLSTKFKNFSFFQGLWRPGTLHGNQNHYHRIAFKSLKKIVYIFVFRKKKKKWQIKISLVTHFLYHSIILLSRRPRHIFYMRIFLNKILTDLFEYERPSNYAWTKIYARKKAKERW